MPGPRQRNEQLAPATPAARRRRSRGGTAPSHASEISPRSSETTTTTASISSARPIAARWRVPTSRSSCEVVSGRRQPRCGDAPAPHDHRAVVQRAARQEQRDEQLGRQLGLEPHARSRPRLVRSAARSMTISAPATATRQLGRGPRHRSPRRRRAPAGRRGSGHGAILPRPRRASPRRMSAWNSTITPR